MKIIVIISLLFALAACVSEEPIPISDFSGNQLVVDGYFTNQVAQQELSVGLANNLGDTAKVEVSNFTLQLTSGSQVIAFDLVDGNSLVSQQAFAGQADDSYQLEFCYQGDCQTASILMPQPIIINEFSVHEDTNSLSDFWKLIDVTLTSYKAQYLRYEIYTIDPLYLPDTVWTRIEQPIYWTEEVKSATNQQILLNQAHPLHFDFSNTTGVKIKIYSLSNEVGTYLESLESFMEGEFAGSQYQNPPFFHDGQVQGLVYGSCVDSATYYF